ncbi:MAG: DUF3168 domain-containing protein [Asticcacaulis sp.]
MTMDAFRALQKGLLVFLKNQPSLRVWLGAVPRIYDAVPPEPVYPYVRIGRAEARSVGGQGPEATEQVVTLTAVSRFAGTEEARAIAAELRLLLEQADLILEGQHVVSVRVTYVDVFRSTDRYSVHGLVRFRVVSEAAV